MLAAEQPTRVGEVPRGIAEWDESADRSTVTYPTVPETCEWQREDGSANHNTCASCYRRSAAEKRINNEEGKRSGSQRRRGLQSLGYLRGQWDEEQQRVTGDRRCAGYDKGGG